MLQIQAVRLAKIAQEVARVSHVKAAATSFGSTLSGPDGGYAVPVEEGRSILMPQVGALLPRCTQLTVTRGSSLELPIDLATPYANNGIVAGWNIEGDPLTSSRPKLNLESFNLKKLTALVPVTDELLEDSNALAAYLPMALQNAVTRQVNDVIVAGLGAGLPLGMLKSGGTITVAKASGQTAATIVDANIESMLARALSPLTSIWIVNPAAYGKVTSLAGFHGGSRTLAGLPIETSDSCPALGTAGDIILADMSGYLVALKTPQLNSSMHLWFDQDLTAFKLTFRMDGMPMLAQPVTPPNSAASKSHFVTVAVRA